METRFFTLLSQNVAGQKFFCLNVKTRWQVDPASHAPIFLPVSPPTKKTNTSEKCPNIEFLVVRIFSNSD